MPTFEFTYPSVAASEEKMLDDVQLVLKASRIERELYDNFMLVVSEAFTNALVHGNERNALKAIKLVLDINEDALAADITDEGQGGLDRVKLKCRPTMFSEGGRGVDIMRHFASVVAFAETEHGGLKVSIRFDRLKKSKLERLT